MWQGLRLGTLVIKDLHRAPRSVLKPWYVIFAVALLAGLPLRVGRILFYSIPLLVFYEFKEFWGEAKEFAQDIALGIR